MRSLRQTRTDSAAAAQCQRLQRQTLRDGSQRLLRQHPRINPRGAVCSHACLPQLLTATDLTTLERQTFVKSDNAGIVNTYFFRHGDLLPLVAVENHRGGSAKMWTSA